MICQLTPQKQMQGKHLKDVLGHSVWSLHNIRLVAVYLDVIQWITMNFINFIYLDVHEACLDRLHIRLL